MAISVPFVCRDLAGHIVEFSGDQHGSRLVQKKIEEAMEKELDIIFAGNCCSLSAS